MAILQSTLYTPKIANTLDALDALYTHWLWLVAGKTPNYHNGPFNSVV